MDDKWRFNYLWEKMQKRIDDLERQVEALDRWKRQQIDKQYRESQKK